jgi:hypothetical protein
MEKAAQFRGLCEEARKGKAAFVARVSHKLRTQLDMTIGLAAPMISRRALFSD